MTESFVLVTGFGRLLTPLTLKFLVLIEFLAAKSFWGPLLCQSKLEVVWGT